MADGSGATEPAGITTDAAAEPTTVGEPSASIEEAEPLAKEPTTAELPPAEEDKAAVAEAPPSEPATAEPPPADEGMAPVAEPPPSHEETAPAAEAADSAVEPDAAADSLLEVPVASDPSQAPLSPATAGPAPASATQLLSTIYVDSGTGSTKLISAQELAGGAASLRQLGRTLESFRKLGDMPPPTGAEPEPAQVALARRAEFARSFAENLAGAGSDVLANVDELLVGCTAWYRDLSDDERSAYEGLWEELRQCTAEHASGAALRVTTITGEEEAHYEHVAASYAAAKVLGVELDCVLSLGSGSVQCSCSSKHGGALCSFNLPLRDGKEMLTADCADGVGNWERACAETCAEHLAPFAASLATATVGEAGADGSSSSSGTFRLMAAGASWYAGVAAGLATEEEKPSVHRLDATLKTLKELAASPDRNTEDGVRERVNAVRLGAALEAIFSSPESSRFRESAEVVFARKWMINGVPFHTTWSAGHFLEAIAAKRKDTITSSPPASAPDASGTDVKPVSAEMASAEPASGVPAAEEPTAHEPIAPESASAELASAEPASAEPASTEPASADPEAPAAALELASAEPVPAEPPPSEPVSGEPTAAEPAHEDIPPAEPILVEAKLAEAAEKEPASPETVVAGASPGEVESTPDVADVETSSEKAAMPKSMASDTSPAVKSKQNGAKALAGKEEARTAGKPSLLTAMGAGPVPGLVVYVVAPAAAKAGEAALSNDEYRALSLAALRSGAAVVLSAASPSTVAAVDFEAARASKLLGQVAAFADRRFKRPGVLEEADHTFGDLFAALETDTSGVLDAEKVAFGLRNLGFPGDYVSAAAALSPDGCRVTREDFCNALAQAVVQPEVVAVCPQADQAAAAPAEDVGPTVRAVLVDSVLVGSATLAAKTGEARRLAGAGNSTSYGVVLVLAARGRSLLPPADYEQHLRAELEATAEHLPLDWPLLWSPGPAEVGLMSEAAAARAVWSMPKAAGPDALTKWLRYLLVVRPSAPLRQH